MAGELEKLLRDAGIPQEQIDATVKAFDPAAITALEKGVMRQSDYSRAQDRLKAEREDLQAKWNTANTEYQRMVNDYESTAQERDEARKKLEEAEKKLKETPQIDPAKFLTPEQLNAKLQEVVTGSTAYFGDVFEIVDEHRNLYGNAVSARELMQKAAEAKKTPREYWEETYKVQEKRDEVAKKKQEERDEAIRKEGYEKAVTELSKPPSAREFDSSKSPFYTPKEETKSPWDDAGPTEAETNLLKELTQVGR